MLDVVAELRLRLVRSADAAVIFKQTYVRHSARRARFAEWAREDAADFRSARDELLDTLARDVALDLFGAERSVAATTASDEPTSRSTTGAEPAIGPASRDEP